MAITLLARAGFEQVIASSGRPEQEPYFRELGATGVMPRSEFADEAKPLESERWSGSVDTVGGNTLAKLVVQTKSQGAVAACGLAGGSDLDMTVFPYILRGVSLLGINSVYLPHSRRLRAWERIARDLPAELIDNMIQVEPFAKVPELSQQVLAGQVRGRIVVDMG